jgi:enamine deaminase RidA (YjgF/YER057c/UK114 family)
MPDISPESRLAELGIELPVPRPPVGAFVPAVRTGNLVFLSGAGPISNDRIIVGKVGADVDLDTAKEAARLVALQLLAALRAEIGSLDRVARIVKVLGMVNCAPGFNDTPAVIDGCSQLLLDVFGDTRGPHARSAVGMAELPFDISVEIEMVVEAVSEGA